MQLTHWLNDTLRYFSEAVARIFGPDDDAYPEIGVQPYEGDPYSA